MLVGIVGPLCSGKHITAEYLVQQHGFLRLHLPGRPSVVSSALHSSHIRTTGNASSHGRNHSENNYGSDSDQQDHEWRQLQPSIADEKGTRGLTFPDVDSLLEFVTKRWREHWVLTNIADESTLELLMRRPFFLLLSVDAPVSVRYARFNKRCAGRGLSPMSMERFIEVNDALLYGGSLGTITTTQAVTRTLPSMPADNSRIRSSASASVPNTAASHILDGGGSSTTSSTLEQDQVVLKGTAQLHSHAHLQILNHQPTTVQYFSFLSTLDLPSQTRLRPPWDAYFMTLAHLASLRSNCMKRRVGCVLVLNNRILSTGYNGTPRNLTNCNEGGCPRCNTGPGAGNSLSTCLCLHAEENALLEAGRERIREGAVVLYCDTCPCLTCSVKIAQVGVNEVVYSQSYNMDDASRRVLAEAGVKLRQYNPPKTGLVGLDFDDLGVVSLHDHES